MTKTLTEQWREGTLEYGYYYVKHTFGWKPFGITIDFWHGPFDKWGAIPNDYVKEVLAPVPSYDEYNQLVSNSDELILCLQKMVEDECSRRCKLETKCHQLEKRLEIATKALKDYANSDEWELVDSKSVYWSRKRFPYPWRIAGKALKEMEGVK